MNIFGSTIIYQLHIKSADKTVQAGVEDVLLTRQKQYHHSFYFNFFVIFASFFWIMVLASFFLYHLDKFKV